MFVEHIIQRLTDSLMSINVKEIFFTIIFTIYLFIFHNVFTVTFDQFNP